MGVRILEGKQYGDAVFYCSVTMHAFGPVMDSVMEAEKFFDWLKPLDPRTLQSQGKLLGKYLDFKKFHWKPCPDCTMVLVKGDEARCELCQTMKEEEADAN